MKTKGFKKFLRELLFRPFNIILMPLLVIVHFYSWLITDDKEWNEPSRWTNKSDKEYSEETIWWKL